VGFLCKGFFDPSNRKEKLEEAMPVEEYLTVKELSQRIKLAVQTIYNFIHKEKFILGKHYLKPTPKKILFKWSEIKEWMGEGTEIQGQSEEMSPEPNTEPAAEKLTTPVKTRASRQAKSLINI
jgi:predicted DNA-binding transcriptional regulator AlpA